MPIQAEQLALLLAIATLANGIVAAIVTPLFEKFKLDHFWLLYAAWAVAGVLSFLARVNVFVSVFEVAIIGQMLTAVSAGRASNILHDLTDKSSG